MKKTESKAVAAANLALQPEKHAFGPDLKLTITIPGAFVPLFKAMVAIHTPGEQTETLFASRAVCHWMLSEDALQKFDDLVNELNV